MSASSISLALLIVLSAVVLLRWMLKLKPQAAKLGSQKMCPFCGLITPRFKAHCMECGKPFTAVAYSISKK